MTALKKAARWGIGLTVALTCLAASGSRSHWSMITYLDAGGAMVGFEMIPCEGPPSLTGIRTANFIENTDECIH